MVSEMSASASAQFLLTSKHQPRHEFHLALAHEVADAEHQAGALFDRGAAPGSKASSAAFIAGSTCSLPAF